MVERSLVRTHSSKLLNALLDNSELPQFAARLETPTLNKLIEHVGLEDAGALISYTTDRPLRSILDDSLWASLAPGKPETHRPEEFIRWLYILLDQGEAFLAERLVGLGVEYAVLNLAQLVSVHDGESIRTGGCDLATLEEEDYEVLERYAGSAAYAEEFDGYYVTAVYDEEWDVTCAAITALYAEHPAFLDHVFYRMCRGDASNLMHDISGDRRDSKESAGYVTPESATAFLELTRHTSLASLVFGGNHDPVSNRHFSQLGAFSGEEPADDSGEADEEESDSPPRKPDAEKHKELEELLIEAEIVVNEPSALLLTTSATEEVLPVKSVLDGLQHVDGKLFSERLSELVYLSNVLIAGTMLDGKRFDEVEAAHAALATCNIGMSYLSDDVAEEEAVRDGLVRLFRIGWQILLQIPKHVTLQPVSTLRSTEITTRLFDRRWILSEVDATLDELVEHVDQARFDEARTGLAFVSLVIEQETCDALQLMVSDYPRYPLGTEPRFVESMDDLSKIDDFLGSLADFTK